MRVFRIIVATVATVWLTAILTGSLASSRVLEVMLEPWLVLCRIITRGAWQPHGNALLGLLSIATAIPFTDLSWQSSLLAS